MHVIYQLYTVTTNATKWPALLFQSEYRKLPTKQVILYYYTSYTLIHVAAAESLQLSETINSGRCTESVWLQQPRLVQTWEDIIISLLTLQLIL